MFAQNTELVVQEADKFLGLHPCLGEIFANLSISVGGGLVITRKLFGAGCTSNHGGRCCRFQWSTLAGKQFATVCLTWAPALQKCSVGWIWGLTSCWQTWVLKCQWALEPGTCFWFPMCSSAASWSNVKGSRKGVVLPLSGILFWVAFGVRLSQMYHYDFSLFRDRFLGPPGVPRQSQTKTLKLLGPCNQWHQHSIFSYVCLSQALQEYWAAVRQTEWFQSHPILADPVVWLNPKYMTWFGAFLADSDQRLSPGYRFGQSHPGDDTWWRRRFSSPSVLLGLYSRISGCARVHVGLKDCSVLLWWDPECAGYHSHSWHLGVLVLAGGPTGPLPWCRPLGETVSSIQIWSRGFDHGWVSCSSRNAQRRWKIFAESLQNVAVCSVASCVHGLQSFLRWWSYDLHCSWAQRSSQKHVDQHGQFHRRCCWSPHLGEAARLEPANLSPWLAPPGRSYTDTGSFCQCFAGAC